MREAVQQHYLKFETTKRFKPQGRKNIDQRKEGLNGNSENEMCTEDRLHCGVMSSKKKEHSK